MTRLVRFTAIVLAAILAFVGRGAGALAQQPPSDFDALVKKLDGEKPQFAKRQMDLLAARYDLADRAGDAKMSRGKGVQDGVRVRLPQGVTWEQLAAMKPEDIKNRGLWPAGFYPLPHPKHEMGGMVFPKTSIDEIKKQTGRDLSRFDVDFDIPDHMLPEFPPPIYLTTRPDLGDVSQGKLLTLANFRPMFVGILNRKQLEGLRLLLTPFPQQQFNVTEDRRSLMPSEGVACLDCHINGHSSGATHTVGDVRPNEHRRRIETTSLARRKYPAVVRLAAGPQVGRGLYRVRAAGRVFRRRPGTGDQEGR